MKKFVFVTLACLFLSLQAYSQQHIRFNGATFGQPLQSFIQSFHTGTPTKDTMQYAPEGFNSNICNRNCYVTKLNSQDWYCHVFSSRLSNTVFRTISVRAFYGDLETQLMLLVKTLEGKYGGGAQEKQEDLGKIRYFSDLKREMLALYYYVKNANGATIGEIRISAAPTDKEATSGWVEISYTDYKSRDLATREYNTLMNDTF